MDKNMIQVQVTEDPNTVSAFYDGKVHKAEWDNERELTNVSGDENFLIAIMMAWGGEEIFSISPDELEKSGGGYWAKPKT